LLHNFYLGVGFCGVSVTHFSANLNAIALLRNRRDNGFPNVLDCARRVLEAGAAGITVHPRPDERHTRTADVAPLMALTQEYAGREFNIEGNPHHNLMQIVTSTRPHQATFVPDSEHTATSNRGFAPGTEMDAVAPLIAQLKGLGVRVSIFVDADIAAVEAVAAAGADRIELYTEPYAHAYAAGTAKAELARFTKAAERARACKLGVNAGHDLNLINLPAFLQAVRPDEVSIGHAFVADAIVLGIDAATRAYVQLCNASV
jgi:pyridoxine 5-phosphate synthase